MFTALNILAVTALVLLAIIVVVKIKEFAQSQDRRQVASPYGILRAPSDARLRRTREVHVPICECEVPDRIKGTSYCYKCGNDLSLRTIEGKEVENGNAERGASPESD